MPPRIRIIAIIMSFALVLYVFELVRRRYLNEEYSLGWLITGMAIFILALWEDLLSFITHLVGATLFTSTLFFFGLFFLMIICLHFSVRISTLTNQVKKLTQRLAILSSEMEELKDRRDG